MLCLIPAGNGLLVQSKDERRAVKVREKEMDGRKEGEREAGEEEMGHVG